MREGTRMFRDKKCMYCGREISDLEENEIYLMFMGDELVACHWSCAVEQFDADTMLPDAAFAEFQRRAKSVYDKVSHV